MDRRLARSPGLSPKSPAIYEKYKSGCAWGLIHFFDFRQGHSHGKLISDRKRVNRQAKGDGHTRNRLDSLANEKHQLADDAPDKKNLAVNSRKPEVKKVREEEMSVKHQTNKNTAIDELQNLQINPKLLGHSKDHRKESKNSKKSSHVPAHDGVAEGYRRPSDQNMADKSSNNKAVKEASGNDVQAKNSGNHREKSVRERKHDHHTEINPRVHMNEAVEAFVNQKLTDVENLSRNELANRSKDFIDALEILNSNKELFMKLLQDPNSLLVKHIQGLRDSQAKKQQPQSSSIAQNAPTQPKEAGEGEPSNTIILLKPGMQNCPDRIGNWPSSQSEHSLRRKEKSVRPAFLSFEHMKRKLRHAMRVNKKEHCHMFLEGIYKSQDDFKQLEDGGKEMTRPANERIPAGNKHLDPVKLPQSSHGGRRRDGMGQTENSASGVGGKAGSSSESCHTTSNLLNARQHKGKFHPRKHLSEVPNKGNEDFSRKQTLRTLDRLMSFPEQDFLPTLTPRRDMVYESASTQMRSSPYSSVSSVNGYKLRVQNEKENACLGSSAVKSLGAQPMSETEKPDDRLHEAKTSISSNLPPAAQVLQTVYSLGDDLSQKVDQTSVRPGKVVETNHGGERKDLEPNVKQNNRTNLRTEAVNISGENEYFERSKLDSPLMDQTSTYSSSPLHSQRAEDSDSMTDVAEHPSPISVLEQFFVEDNTSSPSTVSLAAEPPVESSCLDVEQLYASSLMESDLVLRNNEGTSTDKQGSAYEYIRAVVQISGLNWDELSRWHFSEEMLDPSLFDNVEIWPDKSRTDRKLLFGYISEVLWEIYECSFRCSPWVSLLKPSPRPVLLSKNVVHEVLRHMDWLLVSELPQQRLQQLVEKDLAKSGAWMNTQIETEEVVIELVDDILQDLVVEAAIQMQT